MTGSISSRHSSLGPIARNVAKHELAAKCKVSLLWPQWMPESHPETADIIEYRGSAGYILQVRDSSDQVVSIICGPAEPYEQMRDSREEAIPEYESTWSVGNDGHCQVRVNRDGVTAFIYVRGWTMEVARSISQRLIWLPR